MSFNRQPPPPPVFRQIPQTQEEAETLARTREGMRAMQERGALWQAQVEARRQTPEFLEQQARIRAEEEIRARTEAEAQARVRAVLARAAQEREQADAQFRLRAELARAEREQADAQFRLRAVDAQVAQPLQNFRQPLQHFRQPLQHFRQPLQHFRPGFLFNNIQRPMQQRVDLGIQARDDAEAQEQLRAVFARNAEREYKTDELKSNVNKYLKYLKYKNKYLSLKKDIFISKQKNH
jgi:hypothetical protein